MQTVLFAIPIKTDRFDTYKAFTEEITGPKRNEYIAMLKRYGLRTANVWHHQFNDKTYVIVVHNTDDNAMELLATWSASTHPFDCWFNEQCLKCYDIENFDNLPPQPQILFGIDTNTDLNT
ncbi:MAG: hypothetical protein GY821_16930 [Gammaproteobacteria bacterium]|nr:hypothetical protein [Gammaproteobacteria bacterium]